MTRRPREDLKQKSLKGKEWGGGRLCVFPVRMLYMHVEPRIKHTHWEARSRMLNKLVVCTSKRIGVCACEHLRHCWATAQVAQRCHTEPRHGWKPEAWGAQISRVTQQQHANSFPWACESENLCTLGKVKVLISKFRQRAVRSAFYYVPFFY